MVGYLFLSFLAGMVCAVLAAGRGRNVLAWFAIGSFLPVLGIILVLVLPDETVATELSRDPGASVPKQSPREDLRMLAVLRQRGILTDAEFEDKKQLVLAAEKAAAAESVVVDVAAAEQAEAKAMLATAEARHFAKDFSEAKRSYQDLVSRFPSSKQAAVARQQIANLRDA
jgi:hypothetical protein